MVNLSLVNFWHFLIDFLKSVLGVAVQKTQTNFDFFMVGQLSRHFRQFWPTLIFLIANKKNGGGGNPKFIFTIFHLVRHNWMYTQNFRSLWPFLVVFLCRAEKSGEVFLKRILSLVERSWTSLYYNINNLILKWQNYSI